MANNRRRPEADDILQMAEHRRSMQALRRASTSAAGIAHELAGRHLHLVPTSGDVTVRGRATAQADGNVVNLAARRAQRSGHPAGRNLHA